MSILDQELVLLGSRGSVRALALFDSGASYSIIRRDVAMTIENLIVIPDPENYEFETARPGDIIRAEFVVRLEFRFDDSDARFSDEFVVFDELPEPVIIGAKTMQAWQIRLDFANERLEYRKTAQRLRV